MCRDHAGTALEEESRREMQSLNDSLASLAVVDGEEARRAALQRFQERMERGEYPALFSSDMREMLREAGKGRALDEELGAVRMALLQVVMEVEDPLQRALAVARLTNAASRAARVRQFEKPTPEEHAASWDRAAKLANLIWGKRDGVETEVSGAGANGWWGKMGKMDE